MVGQGGKLLGDGIASRQRVSFPSAIIFGSRLSLTMPFGVGMTNGGLSDESNEHRLGRSVPVCVGSGATASNCPGGARFAATRPLAGRDLRLNSPSGLLRGTHPEIWPKRRPDVGKS